MKLRRISKYIRIAFHNHTISILWEGQNPIRRKVHRPHFGTFYKVARHKISWNKLLSSWFTFHTLVARPPLSCCETFPRTDAKYSVLQETFGDVTQSFAVTHIHSMGLNYVWNSCKGNEVCTLASIIEPTEYCSLLGLKRFIRAYSVGLNI
jgi:hypothetical protein